MALKGGKGLTVGNTVGNFPNQNIKDLPKLAKSLILFGFTKGIRTPVVPLEERDVLDVAEKKKG